MVVVVREGEMGGAVLMVEQLEVVVKQGELRGVVLSGGEGV